MEQIGFLSDPRLVEAVLLWTGWGKSSIPVRDSSALLRRFGVDLAPKLLSAVKQLEEEFYASDASMVAADLQAMEKLCAERFRKRNPGIAEEILKAFAWCYTFDFK